ncbi:hypothetical protein ADJ76_07980 [Schaalia meyeri]|nr:hypothetical protein ADJ76_07980 [Schaalia meyeri]
MPTGAYAFGLADPTYPPTVMLLLSFPGAVAASLPQLIERSVRPFAPSRPRYVDSAIVIRGNHDSIAHMISVYLLGIAAAALLIYGLITRYPLQAATYAGLVVFALYWDGIRRPFSDLPMALRHKQTTTLTPEGIVFHFPPPLSFESHERDAEVTILWKQGIHIESVEEHIIYLSNLSHEGPWDLCADHIGITYTGIDAIMRHFNDHPQDRPLLATPNGLDLVNQILTKAHKTITNPTNK